jgi:hypothetical protein
MNRIVTFGATALCLLLVGCGDDDDTRFGDADDVRAYRTAINPLIDEVAEVVDDEGVSIDSRLNAVFVELLPRLLVLKENLAQLRAPQKLQALQDTITQMVQLSLEGSEIVIDGFAAGDISVYPTAVERRQQADDLVPAINVQLCEVDVVLGDRDDCRLLASHTDIRAKTACPVS